LSDENQTKSDDDWIADKKLKGKKALFSEKEEK